MKRPAAILHECADRRDDPRCDARAAGWVRIEPDGDGWCVVLYGTGPDGERADDFFVVLHRHARHEDCETVHGSLVQLLGDVIECETRGRDAALDAADRLADAADRIHDMRDRDPDRELAEALAAYLVARGAR